ncbi:sigma-54 interaction domain-containing protein [Oligoflexus tunisiensis]|uniref:sigma-54 interaction domain-containing protein n=1 Tax=Oligoflexus tunisiensis TaxID=708132 RepID=UPI00114D0729|nr:sigma 54-interacting transcriptional regulator [Oligoflexus tunisiensis]
MNQRNLYDSNVASELIPQVLDKEGPLPVGTLRQALDDIVGKSEAMEKVFQTIGKVARSDSPVLIHGESGTGKELVACALHRLSHRASRRFLAVNCSAIPETLLESELFGYVKGAFTGADKSRKGYFEEAAGGTLFLDEIGEMPPRLQAKLLRVLQEKQYSPIGSNEVKISDVRVITATNVDLEEAVAQGRFRLDLFYRLNVLPITLPPLRDRKGDVRQLLDYFLQRSNQLHELNHLCYFQTEVYQCLEQYPWPGNVRELQNLIERLVVMSGGGSITLESLPPEYRRPKAGATSRDREIPVEVPKDLIEPEWAQDAQPAGAIEILPVEGIDLEHYIERLENSLIMQALERTGNNKNQAAKLLGLNRTTLVERIKKRKLVPLNLPSKEL